MSFLDLYQGDQDQAAKIQPNEGHDLPSGFTENFNAAWSDGQLFSQSIARANARAGVLHDYVDEIRQKTGNDLSKDFMPDTAGGGTTGVTDFDTANARVAKLKASYPELDLNTLSEDEIDKRAVAKAQAAHRSYEALQAGEKTGGGSLGSFVGSAASAAVDPINIVALAIAPETGGASILSAALRWGALAGVSQAAIEAASDTFKEQVQPGYMESGAPIKEIGGAFVGGAALGGGLKALGNAWTRVKTGAWPTSVRDAGNVIESEANVAGTNIFPGVEGEVAHREALVKTIDDILAGRPVDVGAQITPELQQAAVEAAQKEPEKIISAATRFDGKLYEGQTHADAYKKYIDETNKTDADAAAAYGGDGFITSTGRFVDREEAQKIAEGASQVPENTGKTFADRQLYAEQLKTKQLELPLAPETEPVAPKRAVEPGPQPELQTAEQMRETMITPDHQDAIRADIDRERMTGDFKVPGIDENGNHTMIGVDAAVEEVDAYKKLADDIQVCASPAQEAAE